MITHIVLFKLKQPTKEILERTRQVLLNMDGKIPELLQIEAGIDVLRSERSYDIGLVTKFHGLDELAAYQIHPVHKEVIRYMHEVRESSICIDYEDQ